MNYEKNKPPVKKRPSGQVESTAGKRPDERPTAAEAERTEPPSIAPPADEPAVSSRQPVTNQDEQDRITNASSDDIADV